MGRRYGDAYIGGGESLFVVLAGDVVRTGVPILSRCVRQVMTA